MSQKTKIHWEKMRTDDSRMVENVLRKKFPNADAYRYNSASIRVRIIDSRFEGKTAPQRDRMVEPVLQQLPEDIQREIMTLLTLYPDETGSSLSALMQNHEFEDPSPSIL